MNGVKRAASSVAAVAFGTAVLTSAPVSAEPPVVSTEVNHFVFSQHFDPPPCGIPPYGSTEILTGMSRLHVTEFDDTLHVSFGEAFNLTEIADDPSIPVRYRQVTDAGTFQVSADGTVQVFHESFHDKNTVYGDLVGHTTFVVVNGAVHVDHTLTRGEIPC
jgi:hypothetical protein